MKRISLVLLLAISLTSCAAESEKAEVSEKATIYFVADTPRGFKLFSEKREFSGSEDLAEMVISDLISGEITPLDSDYSNLWGSTNSLKSITTSGTVATIDLGTLALNVGSESEQRAIEQIVWTYLDLNSEINAVRFTVNGEVVESFAGHVDTTGEFTRAPSYEVLNPLQISSFTDGEVLSNPVKISGEACTFEANVLWRLSKAGKVIKEEPTTAATSCPDRSPWSVELDQLEPGTYKFEAIEYSAEDGSLFAIDDKTFIIKK